MRCILIVGLTFLLVNSGYAQTLKTIGRIERLDSAFDQWVPAGAEIEVLAEGFTWTEGPVWFPGSSNSVDQNDDGYLLFSDIPRNSIFKWSPRGGIELFMQPSGYTGVTYYGLEPGSNGLARDARGQLLLCEHGDRRISVLHHGGGKQTLVDRFEGKRLNSPNDLIPSESGSIYFTDPPYGLPDRAEDKHRELDFCGVFRLDPDGKLSLLTKELSRPNGLGLSPDQRSLYVSQSDPDAPIWMKYPIGDDGMLEMGTEIANARSAVKEFPGLPDGLAVHPSGVLFASGPGGIYVMTDQGKLLGRIIIGHPTSNCTFNSDFTTLYITADSHLCRVKLGGKSPE